MGCPSLLCLSQLEGRGRHCLRITRAGQYVPSSGLPGEFLQRQKLQRAVRTVAMVFVPAITLATISGVSEILCKPLVSS